MGEPVKEEESHLSVAGVRIRIRKDVYPEMFQIYVCDTENIPIRDSYELDAKMGRIFQEKAQTYGFTVIGECEKEAMRITTALKEEGDVFLQMQHIVVTDTRENVLPKPKILDMSLTVIRVPYRRCKSWLNARPYILRDLEKHKVELPKIVEVYATQTRRREETHQTVEPQACMICGLYIL